MYNAWKKEVKKCIPELWGTTSGFLSSTSGISSTDFLRGTVDLSCSGLDLSPPLFFGTRLSSPLCPRPLITSTITIATRIRVATTAIRIPRMGVIFKRFGLTDDASVRLKIWKENRLKWEQRQLYRRSKNVSRFKMHILSFILFYG